VLLVRESRRPGGGISSVQSLWWKCLLLVAELGAPPAGRLADVEKVTFSVCCLHSGPRRDSSSLVRVIVEAMIIGDAEVESIEEQEVLENIHMSRRSNGATRIIDNTYPSHLHEVAALCIRALAVEEEEAGNTKMPGRPTL